MNRGQARCRQGFHREVAIGDRIEGIALGAVETKGGRGHGAVDRKCRAGERGRAERAFVEALAGIGKPSPVAPEHLDIGQRMMAEGDRLGTLQMGKTRHRGCGMTLGLVEERGLKRAKSMVEFIDGVTDKELEVGRDLIISRACRVQPSSHRSDQLAKPGFDVEVNILILTPERETVFGDFTGNCVEAFEDRFAVVARNDTGSDQHGAVGARTFDVLLGQTPVDIDRCVDRFHRLVRAGAETTAPHFVACHGARLKHGGSMTERLLFRALLGVLVLSLGAVYAIALIRDNGPASISELKSPKDTLVRFVWARPPRPAPALVFAGPDGAPMSLSAFAGRVVLVNLWATWCQPCLEEMPALARLEAVLGGPDFAVVALNADRDADKARQWMAENRIEGLTFYHEPTMSAYSALEGSGLPLSVLIDREGRMVGRLAGAAAWDAREAVVLIRGVMGETMPALTAARPSEP